MKAGHGRALAELSRQELVRWRCPNCLEDVRYPAVTVSGIECPYCANVDTRRAVSISRRPTRSGFEWVARFEERP